MLTRIGIAEICDRYIRPVEKSFREPAAATADADHRDRDLFGGLSGDGGGCCADEAGGERGACARGEEVTSIHEVLFEVATVDDGAVCRLKRGRRVRPVRAAAPSRGR